MLAQVILFCALAGLVSCTGFLALLAVSLIRFRLHNSRLALITDDDLPPVTLLKPLHGLEPELEQNLETFFRQDYPDYEIVFGARHANDPALRIVEELRKRYPLTPVRVVLSGEPNRPNAKICSLEKMIAAAHSDYLVISDSDVRVTPDYVAAVARPLLNPKVGLVTCMYRGVPTGGLWSRLEGLGMSVEMTSGVMIADLLEGMKFALGPTMATRRDVLSGIGGIGVLAEYCSDDFVLGQKIYEGGWRVVLSNHAVDHVICNRSLKDSLLHQVRWMKSTRFSRPKGHVGTGLTFAMPFGLLACASAYANDMPAVGAVLLAYAFLNRVVESVVAGWGVVHDPLAVRYCWLYPVRDLLGFFLWCASFVGKTVVWRNESYRLQFGGKMVREGAVAMKPASGTVAVDHLA